MSEMMTCVPWPFDPPSLALQVLPNKGDPHEVQFVSSQVSEQQSDTLIRVTSTTYSLSWWVPFADITFQVAEREKTEPEFEYAELDLGPEPEPDTSFGAASTQLVFDDDGTILSPDAVAEREILSDEQVAEQEKTEPAQEEKSE